MQGRVGLGRGKGRVGLGGGGVEYGRVGYLWSNYECFLISGCKDIDF